MISNFLRKLNPYAGYMGGGSDSGGGGGGGGYSSFDDEFEAAIAQDEANKASGGGGVSYGTGGYVGSDSGSSSPDPVVAAPTYTADDGTVFSNLSSMNSYNEQLAQAEFEAAIGADYALREAYNLGSTNIFSNDDGSITYYQPTSSGGINIIDSPTQEQILEANLNQSSFDANQLAIDYGVGDTLSKAAIEDPSQGFFDSVINYFKDDAVKVNGIEDFGVAVNQFAVQDYLNRSGYDVGEYNIEELGSLWDDFTYRGADNYNFGNFINQYNYLKDNTSNVLYDSDIVVKEMNGENMMFASDPFSFEGITANLGDFLINSLGGYMGGMILGDVVYAATGNPMAALGSASIGDKVISNVGLVDNQVFLGADGVQYIQSDSIFGEPTFTPIETAVSNATQAATQSTAAIGSGDFDMQSSLSQGISGTSNEEALTYSGRGDTPSWKDYYKFSLDPKEAITEVITGANINPEVYKAAQLAMQLDSGVELKDAALNVYGSDIVNWLPEDFQNPTEAAIRIGAGENKIQVLGDIYGSDVGLDNPLGQAGLSSAVTYDQTGDGQKALEDGLVTYIKEGGKFPEFDVPDFLPDSDINLDFDFDFLSNLKGQLPELKLADWVTDFELPTGVFKGVNFGDLAANFPEVKLPDIKDLGISIPDLDFTGVEFADLDMSLPEIKELGIDWEGLDLGGFSLPKILLAGGAQEQAETEQLAYEDPFADTTEEEDTLPEKTPLSQVLLKSTPVA